MLSPSSSKVTLPEIITKASVSKNTTMNKFPIIETNNLADATTLFEIKQRRKIIENDAHVLQNRLKILKQEEARIRKNVNEMQKKTFEIIESKAKQEELLRRKKSIEKLQHGTNSGENIQKTKQIKEYDHNTPKSKIDERYQLLSMANKQRKQQLKEFLKANYEKRKIQDKISLEQKIKKNLKIKAEKVMAIQKKKEFLDDKIEKIKETKYNELEDELKVIEDYQKEFDMMSKREDDILDSINRVTNLQIEVFDKLNEAHTMPSDEAYQILSINGLSKSRFNAGLTPANNKSSVSSSQSEFSNTFSAQRKLGSTMSNLQLKPIGHNSSLSKFYTLSTSQTAIKLRKLSNDNLETKKFYSPRTLDTQPQWLNKVQNAPITKRSVLKIL